MAKSKSGGTRAYIRGKVGADVYSIGKTAKGKKQQVVRSLAETVANPQTESQMRGRMIMSTIMQMVAMMQPIIDHSFDNVTGKQPNISEFISRNYALIKADVAAHPSSGNAFGLNKYQEKGAKAGAYLIADGNVPVNETIQFAIASGTLNVFVSSGNATIGGLLDVLGLDAGDYITICGPANTGTLAYIRYKINDGLDRTTALTEENISTVFSEEGSYEGMVAYDGESHKIMLVCSESLVCGGFIFSKKTANGWEHSQAYMAVNGTASFTADVALPTYPIGGSDFLNGGDIFG